MISEIIYSFIIGDSFGLSILNNDNNDLKLKKNEELNIEKGYFSFFTTNLLATIDSINTNNIVDGKDILNKLTLSLILGKYTNENSVIKPDLETVNILEHYRKKYNVMPSNSLNSNPISRIIPIVVYNYYKLDTMDSLLKVVSITTNNDNVLLGCYIYYKYLLNIINGYDKYKSLKISIPTYFNSKVKKEFSYILKGKIFYKDIVFDDNIVNVLKIVFYVILNSENMSDVLLMCSNLSGNTNIYCSLIFVIASRLYGFNNIIYMKKDIKNKKEINKYINDFKKVFK